MKNKGRIPSPVGVQQNPVSGSSGRAPADDPSIVELEIKERKHQTAPKKRTSKNKK